MYCWPKFLHCAHDSYIFPSVQRWHPDRNAEFDRGYVLGRFQAISQAYAGASSCWLKCHLRHMCLGFQFDSALDLQFSAAQINAELMTWGAWNAGT